MRTPSDLVYEKTINSFNGLAGSCLGLPGGIQREYRNWFADSSATTCNHQPSGAGHRGVTAGLRARRAGWVCSTALRGCPRAGCIHSAARILSAPARPFHSSRMGKVPRLPLIADGDFTAVMEIQET